MEPKIEIESINGVKIEKFLRRPFEVNAVQVTPNNAEEIALWCGGTVSQSNYKLAGFDTTLNTVLVPGNGPNAGKAVEARIGWWVVELEGKFRVLRKRQFQEMFQRKNAGLVMLDIPVPQPGDLVEIRNPESGVDGWQGVIEGVNMICVDIPGAGGYLVRPDEIVKISEYSELTLQRAKEEAEQRLQTMDKAVENGIDQLRAKEEARVAAGGETIHQTLTQAFEEATAVTEVNGMKVGSTVRVTFEPNMFFGEIGVVKSIDPDGRRMFVALNDRGEIDNVPFQPDELELNDVGWGNHKIGDAVETLIVKMSEKADEPGYMYMVPIGSMATVTELNSSDLGGGVTVRFINGSKGYYFGSNLLGIDAVFKQDDMVETKRVLTNTVGTQMPIGTTGRVTVVDIDGEGSGETVEVLFSDGGYAHFRPSELKKI